MTHGRPKATVKAAAKAIAADLVRDALPGMDFQAQAERSGLGRDSKVAGALQRELERLAINPQEIHDMPEVRELLEAAFESGAISPDDPIADVLSGVSTRTYNAVARRLWRPTDPVPVSIPVSRLVILSAEELEDTPNLGEASMKELKSALYALAFPASK